MDFSIIFSAEFWITDSGSAQASVAERLVLPPVKTAGGSMGLSASILDTLKLDPPECPHCGTQMRLAQITPAKPDHDKRMFECRVRSLAHGDREIHVAVRPA